MESESARKRESASVCIHIISYRSFITTTQKSGSNPPTILGTQWGRDANQQQTPHTTTKREREHNSVDFRRELLDPRISGERALGLPDVLEVDRLESSSQAKSKQAEKRDEAGEQFGGQGGKEDVDKV